MGSDKSPLYKSFQYAFKGLKVVVSERNFKLHLLSALACITLGYALKVSPGEWCLLLLCIGGVMALEIMNTAMEKLVDLVSPEWNEVAGKVKDLAAASVLIFSIASLIIGLIIFVPYLLHLVL